MEHLIEGPLYYQNLCLRYQSVEIPDQQTKSKKKDKKVPLAGKKNPERANSRDLYNTLMQLLARNKDSLQLKGHTYYESLIIGSEI